MATVEQQIENDAELARRLNQELNAGVDTSSNSNQEEGDQPLLQRQPLLTNPVGRNVMAGVEDARTRSSRIMRLYMFYACCELVVTTVILGKNWNAACDERLQLFILLYSMRFVVAVPANYYRYRHPQDSNFAKRLITWVDILYFAWFLVGNLWTYRSATCAATAPAVYYWALVLIVITYFMLLLPLILVLGLCLCLPCVFLVLGCLAENEGANTKEINNIPTREFTKDDEPGECAVCMTDFEVGATVSELPCSHRFHEACVNRWLPIKRTCPLCRHDITQNGAPPAAAAQAVNSNSHEQQQQQNPASAPPLDPGPENDDFVEIDIDALADSRNSRSDSVEALPRSDEQRISLVEVDQLGSGGRRSAGSLRV